MRKAQGYEQALNFARAAKLYEELEMWDKARECREKVGRTPTPSMESAEAEEEDWVFEVIDEIPADPHATAEFDLGTFGFEMARKGWRGDMSA